LVTTAVSLVITTCFPKKLEGAKLFGQTQVVTEVKMTTWTRVYYNNLISLGMNLPFMLVAQADHAGPGPPAAVKRP
jgi:hypothetical protein